MKITLKSSVNLKSAVVYLKIQTEVRHEDIKKYLESGAFSNPVIENRVKNYLRDMGIYDDQYQLTAEGRKVRESERCIVKETEEGKYQIWYTQNDPLFGNRIFYFRRIKPDTRIYVNPHLDPLGLNFDQKPFVSLPLRGKDAKDSVNFLVIDPVNGYRSENKTGTTIIDCTWIWNDIKDSVFKFSGKFEWSDYNEKTKKNTPKSDNIDETKELDLSIDIAPYIPQIIPDCNKETHRCKFKMENIKTDDVYQYFEYSGFSPQPREGFDSCYYENLRVEPYNVEEARIWRNRLLKSEIENRYIHPGDYSVIVDGINRKEGFFSYSDTLDVPEIRSFIDGELDHGKKSDRNAAYWHLAAPLDLILDMPQSLRIDSFSLKQGEAISFREIAAKFTAGFSADKVFYFDNYVVNYYQQRSVAVLLKSLDVPEMYIITDTIGQKNDQRFNDYLSKHEPNITVRDISGIYQNRKDAPHDRYLVLKKDGDLQVWTGTNSIDYIHFDSNITDIQPDTKGNIRKSVTFTKIKPDILEEQLKNFILKR